LLPVELTRIQAVMSTVRAGHTRNRPRLRSIRARSTNAVPKIHEASSAVSQLGAAINAVGNLAPSIDTSTLDAAVGRIRSAIASLNSLACSLGHMGPSLGSTMRANFTASEISGE
jgi:hypothetical protein